MDQTQVNRRVRQYLRFDIINDLVEIGLPVFDGGYWYASVEHENRSLGTVVLDVSGNVVKECTPSLQEIIDEL